MSETCDIMRDIFCRKLFFPVTKFRFRYLIFIILIIYQFSYVFCSFSSYEKNGLICYYCPPGFHWIGDCLSTGTQAQCMPCPDNHYQKSQNIAHYCGRCRRCDEVVRNHNASAILVPCTAFANTVCGCKPHHHFIKDYGGMGRGYCQENSQCPPGSGALKSASSSNSDTVCEPCISGFTYNPSPTYEQCLACKQSCPNGLHVKSSCNTTHDMECEGNVDSSKPTKESTSPPNKHEPVLEIALVTIVPVIAIVVVCILCMCWRYRNRSNKRSRDPPVIITHGVKIRRDETASCQRTDNSAAASNDIPSWIRDCIKDENVDWPKMFALCHRYIYIHRWESFIRTLFALSGKAQTGKAVVDCAKEGYPQEKVLERIYQALISWKEKCYSENEHEMVQLFCKVYKGHASS